MTNPTLLKFGYPDTLIRELDHWAILLRPAQVTLGSLVLAAKSEATAFSALPAAAFEELGVAIGLVEEGLSGFCAYERLNYLMLMMVDPNVHFHVIPRYSEPRRWRGHEFADAGWPGPPQLKIVVELGSQELKRLGAELKARF